MKNIHLNVKLKTYNCNGEITFKRKGETQEIKYRVVHNNDTLNKVLDIMDIQKHLKYARRPDFERMDIGEDEDYLLVNLHYKKGITNLQEHELYMFKKVK